MKATIEIPDGLYRKVKARSAHEGRTIRSVTIHLYQSWLETNTEVSSDDTPPAANEAPWLAVSQKYIRPGMDHDMQAIRASIAKGRATAAAGKANRSSGRRS